MLEEDGQHDRIVRRRAAGAGAGVGLAVCATVFELNIDADAATTSTVNNNFPRPIAVSVFNASFEMIRKSGNRFSEKIMLN
jgi:hypothetical protein